MTSHVEYFAQRRRQLIVALVLFAALIGQSFALASEAGWRNGPEGILYKNDRLQDGPKSIHVVKIDRSRLGFKLVTTLARGRTMGLAPLTDQIEALPPELGRPLAAINGDFYRTEREIYAGDPRGLQITQGELVSAPTGAACFWIDAAGNPQIGEVMSKLQVTWPNGSTTPLGLNEERPWRAGTLYTARLGAGTGTAGGREIVLEREGTNSWLPLLPGQLYTARVRQIRDGGNSRLNRDVLVLSLSPESAAKAAGVKPGDLLKISTATSPDLAGAQTAIGGGPALVRGGKVQAVRATKANEWHPRSALGWNKTHYFFVAVDGRQHTSIGMTLPELAFYLAKLGCEEAINLDGGASAELWLGGRIMNNPCFGTERNIGNALVLVQTKTNER
jgi:phosphodiester glycosidase